MKLRNLKNFLNSIQPDDPLLDKQLVVPSATEDYECVIELGIIASTENMNSNEFMGCVALFSGSTIDLVLVDEVVLLTLPNT